MSGFLGLTLGVGLALVWMAWWVPDSPSANRSAWMTGLQDDLIRAGAPGVTTLGLIGTSSAVGLLVSLLGAGGSGSLAIGLAFGVIAGRAPFAFVRARARRRQHAMRDVWPEAVDHLASGIRAGLSLPEALGQLGERGPEEIRDPFLVFAEDFRASGRFGDCLDALKTRLADPVGDRIVEALRITREVGGTDVGRLLRTLGQFLRDDARTRGELEARQSWTVNAARLAVAAPWVVLAVLSTRPHNAEAYNTATGAVVLAVGGIASVFAYRMMVALGRLPEESRVLR